MQNDKPYQYNGPRDSEQAENTSANPAAANVQMRILVELQVIAYLLYKAQGDNAEDLRQLRQNFADSIT